MKILVGGTADEWFKTSDGLACRFLRSHFLSNCPALEGIAPAPSNDENIRLISLWLKVTDEHSQKCLIKSRNLTHDGRDGRLRISADGKACEIRNRVTLCCCGPSRLWRFLNDKWHKRLDPFAIGGIFIGEMPQHESFLLLEFDPEANAHHDNAQSAP